MPHYLSSCHPVLFLDALALVDGIVGLTGRPLIEGGTAKLDGALRNLTSLRSMAGQIPNGARKGSMSERTMEVG